MHTFLLVSDFLGVALALVATCLSVSMARLMRGGTLGRVWSAVAISAILFALRGAVETWQLWNQTSLAVTEIDDTVREILEFLAWAFFIIGMWRGRRAMRGATKA